MTPTTEDWENLVTLATNHANTVYRIVRRMSSWYNFSDKRPGSIVDRFDKDAAKHREYQELFRGF